MSVFTDQIEVRKLLERAVALGIEVYYTKTVLSDDHFDMVLPIAMPPLKGPGTTRVKLEFKEAQVFIFGIEIGIIMYELRTRNNGKENKDTGATREDWADGRQ